MKVFNKRILHVYLHYSNSYNNNEKYMLTTIGDYKTNSIIISSCLMYFRFSCTENKKAAKELCRNYDDNIMGMFMVKILGFHLDKDTCCTLSKEAEEIFEAITDKYSGQFNLKYSTSNQLSASQPELDLEEKFEICVCTKATALIGRLTCILWVYCNGNI